MATKVASLYAEIGADTSGLKRGLDESKTGLDGIMSKLTSVAIPAAAAMTAFNLVGDAIKFSTAAAMEAEVETARLNAILDATGGAAGMTSGELEELAMGLSNMSGVEDEVILRGESVLLTFRAIGQDIFPQATEAALNMSMAMGTDLQSSIIMVGKALNEPIQGIGALRRVGVQLTDEQEEMVKGFMAVNDIAGAQGVILEELSAEFGGVAEAMGDTAQGRVDRMRTAIGNLGEVVGGPFADAVYRGATVMFNLLDGGDAVTTMMAEAEQQALDTAVAYDEYVASQTALLVSEMQITEGRAAEINLMVEQEAWLAQVEATYGTLTQEMIINLVATHALTEEEGDLLTELIGMRGAFDAQITDVGLMTRSMYEYSDALEEVIPGDIEIRDRQREHAEAAREVAEETAALTLTQEELRAAMDDLNMVVGGQLGPEIENFTQTQADLETEMGNVAARIEELSGKSWLTGAEREELENLRGEYGELQGQYEANATAHEEATRRILFDLLTQRAAVDGLSGAELNVLTQIASEWGLVDDATADAAAGFDAAMGLIWEDENGVVHGAQAAKMAVMEVGDQYVDTSDESESAINGLITGPMSAWKTELLEVNGLVDSISGEYDIHFNVTSDPMPNIPNVGSGGGGEGGGGPVDPIRQAEGGDWWVTQPTLFLAGEAGPERATFTPAGEEMPGGGGDTYYITINAGGGADGIQLYNQFKQALENDLRSSERGGVQTSDY